MRVAAAVYALLYSSIVSASTFNFLGSADLTPTEDETFPVPGKNPLEFCADPADYILTIDFVDLSPNPPVPGEILTITANGTFSKDVEAGAKIFLQVKYGLITLIKQEADLCDQLVNVDLTCPLKKGPLSIVKEVEIPKQVPKGKYTVMADVSTVDTEEVTCMRSQIVFS